MKIFSNLNKAASNKGVSELKTWLESEYDGIKLKEEDFSFIAPGAIGLKVDQRLPKKFAEDVYSKLKDSDQFIVIGSGPHPYFSFTGKESGYKYDFQPSEKTFGIEPI